MIDVVDSWRLYSAKIMAASLFVNEEAIANAYNVLRNAIRDYRTIFVFGNGGSAAIADHFATDLTKGVRTSTSAYPSVLSLNSNAALLTAIANDSDYSEVFKYQLESHAVKGDVAVAISSSGNSPNIVKAISAAKKAGMAVIGLSGFNADNVLNTSADVPIHVPVVNYGIVEDIHSNIMHTFSQTLRKEFALPEANTNSFTF